MCYLFGNRSILFAESGQDGNDSLADTQVTQLTAVTGHGR
jgi:hypothetical protein